MTTMPHTFTEIIDETDNRMFMLQETWCIYRQLFGTSEARVDLLNERAPGFAGVVQPVLLDSVILGICRFCDPPSMSGNENLSLKRLIDALDPKPSLSSCQCVRFDASSCFPESFERRFSSNSRRTVPKHPETCVFRPKQ
jgi:hypothetical protein